MLFTYDPRIDPSITEEFEQTIYKILPEIDTFSNANIQVNYSQARSVINGKYNKYLTEFAGLLKEYDYDSEMISQGQIMEYLTDVSDGRTVQFLMNRISDFTDLLKDVPLNRKGKYNKWNVVRYSEVEK